MFDFSTEPPPDGFIAALKAYRKLTGQSKAAVYRFLTTGDATQMNKIAAHILARKRLAK